MIKLTPRLNAVATLVKGGGFIADIGTDHGYLPIYLLQNNIVEGAIASDIGAGPLENARASVKDYNLLDKISLRLSDGLREFTIGEVSEIVFAGMGGTLISEKLQETPWIKDKSLHFIFQPQSRAEDLRKFLFDNGFYINKEIAVHENRRTYIAFDAYFNGEIKEYKLSETFIGKLPKNEDSIKHLLQQKNRLQKKYDALILKGETYETALLFEIINDINDFIK